MECGIGLTTCDMKGGRVMVSGGNIAVVATLMWGGL